MEENDPIEFTEMMELLGANYVDTDDPKRYQQLKDIVGYFSGRDDKRHIIFKILNNFYTKGGIIRNGIDRVDVIWNWVQLTIEREKLTKELPKEQFTEDIQKEIEREYLTKDNIKILKDQLKERIEDENKPEEIEGKEDNKKGDKATEKAVKTSQLQDIQKKVEQIEQINQELDKY